MEIALCLCITLLCGVYIVTRAKRAAEPKYALRSVVTDDKIGYMIASIAFGAKKPQGGNGMSVKSVKRKLNTAYKLIGARALKNARLCECEKTLFDNYYRIDEALYCFGSEKGVKRLPHVKGVPRLYTLCEFLVKSNGGVISKRSVENAIKAYSEETALTYNELELLKAMLEYALCEYLAVYADKIADMIKSFERAEKDAALNAVTKKYLTSGAYLYAYENACENGLPANFPLNANTVKELIDKFAYGITEYNAKITAAVKSLFNISEYFNAEFVCSLSPAYKVLYEGDETFKKLTQATVSVYLKNIARLAKKRRISEKSLAEEIIFRSVKECKDISCYLLIDKPSRYTVNAFTFGYILLWVAVTALFAAFMPKINWLYAIISLPITLFATDFCIKKLGEKVCKRRVLPAYKPQALSSEQATVILMPCYVAGADDINDAFSHLTAIAALNRESVFSYCLLIDYPAASKPAVKEDAKLTDQIIKQYKALGNLAQRACVIVRKRKKFEGGYRGYEKKRGAVIDFNSYVISGKHDFMLKLGDIKGVKYAFTLDSDTYTLQCAEAVGIISHPYCGDQAVVSINCKAAKKDSLFSRLYAGETGPGRYRYCAFDIYNDLLGVGNYTGKGIYDIKKFNERLEGYFPDNRILSHDFIEGAAAGCYNSYISACEDFPQTYASSLVRDIRWLRGDWQLIPYILPKVKNKNGEKIKNRLNSAARLKIAINALISLVPVSQLLIAALSALTGITPLTVILTFLPQVVILAFTPFVAIHSVKAAFLCVCRCVIDFALIPTVAVYRACAAAVTVARLITGRKLLEWQVFAHAKADISFLPNMAFALLFGICGYFAGTYFYIFAFVFVFGYVTGAILNMPPVEKRCLPYEFNSLIISAAKNAFKYFEEQEDLCLLPCDCYQEDNAKGWVKRTSPTNIGMALVAYASAYELGLISRERLTEYIEKIVSAVEKCEKHKGNLYNWYDCDTLQVLPVRFVSTVDSGNFLAALTLVYLYSEGELKSRILDIIENTDLSALYDYKRKLFYIGYNDEIKAHTHNHYDLLGSESSLTYLFACGYGKIPKEAFNNLSRRAVRAGGKNVAVSWTGGAFEYLMTRIFVAPYNNSLMGESMKGAVQAQKAYAKKQKSEVWGISECRYNEYDNCGGNLYRAFGVPTLAHGELPDNMPYAPYAAFLALPYCSYKQSMSNLNAFSELGAYGKFGYYESVGVGGAVKSYMTHHQGMIMACCANALKNDVLVNRLKTLPCWRAAYVMCGEEKVTTARKKRKALKSNGDGALKNRGIYVCRCGALTAAATARDIRIEYKNKRLLKAFSFTVKSGEKTTELLDGSFYGAEKGVWRTVNDSFISEASAYVTAAPLCVAFSVEYRNVSNQVQNVRFRVYCEPVLAEEEEYEAHPAYSRMFIKSGKTEEYAWARRKNSGTTVALAVASDCAVKYNTDKNAVFGIGRGAEGEQNINQALSCELEYKVGIGKACAFTVYYPVADNFTDIKQAVSLVSSCCMNGMNEGGSYALSKSINESVRLYAERLALCRYGAVDIAAVRSDRPAVTFEIKPALLLNLHSVLCNMRTLYELGFKFNTVFFTKKAVGEYNSLYMKTLQKVEMFGLNGVAGGQGGVYVLNCELQSDYEKLKNHSVADFPEPAYINGGVPEKSESIYEYNIGKGEAAPALNQPDILRECAIGGFTRNGYYIPLFKPTPAPWSNVISCGSMGTVITESGGGYTFADNSRQQKITKWSNDPVIQEASEVIAIACKDELWSVTKLPFTVNAGYSATHCIGYSVFNCNHNGISAELLEYIAKEENRKIYKLTLCSQKTVTVGAIAAIEPVLGDFKYNTYASMQYSKCENGIKVSSFSTKISACLYCERAAYPIGLDIKGKKPVVYYGPDKSLKYCGICAPVTLKKGQSAEIYFALGEDTEDFSNAENEFLRAQAYFNKLNAITFDGEFGYLTKWLPYQILSSRVNARAGFYQVSGAYGFRDQLQDCLALLYSRPDIVREHILECCRHQFKEGDVQHWWHPPAIGVRTHVSDDRLWLVYAVTEYILVTGDKALLNEPACFLSDVPITPEASSAYASAEFSVNTASVYEHCLRAIKISSDLNEAGLVRIRGGDWNDAMDKVGEKGKGVTVWGSMFLYYVIQRFLPFASSKDKPYMRETADALRGGVVSMFENDRFLRAVCDNGEVLGGENSTSCKIDLLSQSWATLSNLGSEYERNLALYTAYAILCDGKNKLIKLFDSPFYSQQNVGYIGNYPPYIRENAGQYTQAAVWYVCALFKAGHKGRANELLRWLSPAHRSLTKQDAFTYSVEPYVTVADVYGGELAGKGGWSWYTGSAAWLYKCLIEYYAGIKLRGDTVTFAPALPDDTKELNVTIAYKKENITVKIINSGKGEWHIKIGDISYNTPTLKLSEGLYNKKISLVKNS